MHRLRVEARKELKLDVPVTAPSIHGSGIYLHKLFAYGCPHRGREFDKRRDKEF